MTVRCLVDTDWAINYLRGDAEVIRRLEELKQEGLGLSVISLAELYEGVFLSRNLQASEEGLANFLRRVALIGIDDETCKIYGRERARLRQEGKLAGDFDLLIGATALKHNVALLTNNRRHFETIAGIQLLSL